VSRRGGKDCAVLAEGRGLMKYVYPSKHAPLERADEFIEVTQAQWYVFLKWYPVNIREYEWHLAPMGDYVHVYDAGKLIAYHSFCQAGNTKRDMVFYIGKDECAACLKGVG